MPEFDRLRGRTSIDEVRPGLEMYYNYSDFTKLQKLVGGDSIELAVTRIREIDGNIFEQALKIALKEDSKSSAVSIDDFAGKMPLAKIRDHLLDSIFVCLHGKTYQEYIDEAMKAINDAAEGAKSPPLGSDGSDSTETLPSEPA